MTGIITLDALKENKTYQELAKSEAFSQEENANKQVAYILKFLIEYSLKDDGKEEFAKDILKDDLKSDDLPEGLSTEKLDTLATFSSEEVGNGIKK